MLLPAVRECFAYAADGRATGWLWLTGRSPETGWPPPLLKLGPDLRRELEGRLPGASFTACCFQAYSGGAGVGWHHDRDWAAQAILSLGVTRKLGLRYQEGRPDWLPMAHGDLLYMPPGFQDDWEHCVPQEDVPGERISLVFRSVA
jgi:alkylated DNA repair dioxygenase AlkB